MIIDSNQEIMNAKAQNKIFNLENWGSKVGTEVRKSFSRWLKDGFLVRYFSGDDILDIGYKGYGEDAHPILPWAIGIDLDYPGYDGTRLPFSDDSQDTVFNSHTLEHIPDYRQALSDWFRVLKIGGYLVVIVPHQFLYERAVNLPSRWNADHRRFYTAGSLLREIEEAIDPLCFRVRHLEDNDRGFNYSLPPEVHAAGSYEIILVIEKIRLPAYASQIISGEILTSISEIMTHDDHEFVEGLYRLILRREADPFGKDSYVELLTEGADRTSILRMFVQSEEAEALGLEIPDDVRSLLEQ